MSDITPAIQQQLTQALSQLVKAQGDSPIARQAAQVVVQYLGGNQLNLSLDKNNRSITLDKFASLPSSLQPGAYEGQIQTGQQGKQSANLALYQANTNTIGNSVLAKLNQSQLSAILAAIGQDLQPGAQSKNQIVNANVVSIVGQQATFSTNINGRPQNITIRLVPVPKDLKVGFTVQLQLVPRGNDWQVNLLPANQHRTLTGNQAGTQTNHPSNEARASVSINKSPISLDKTSAATLLRSDPTGDVKSAANVVTADKKSLIAALLKTGIVLPSKALEQLNVLSAGKDTQRVNIVLNTSSSGEIRAPIAHPVANVQLSKQQLQQVQLLLSDTNTKQLMAKGSSTQSSALPPSPTILTRVDQTNVADNAKANAQNNPEVELTQTPLNAKETNKAIKELVAQMSPAHKSELIKQINEISRRLLPNTASPAESIENIVKGLSDQASIKEPSTKVLIETLLKQINQALPQGKQADVENIKQLLTQPVLNLSPTQIVQPAASGQGLVAGLITLLQVSLAARLARTSPSQSEKVAQIVSSVLGMSGKQTTTQTQRSLTDIQQIDQKHQLIKQLGRLFAQHQSTKLTGAEQTMQGQEGLYYILPAGTGENRRDIELLIKREPDKNANNQGQQGKNAVWHLTMKLDIGEVGQLLTKAKLKDTELELDLYTSNEDLKTLVYEYLPLFKKRLQSLGIEVSKTLCQLGKIPQHLQSRPYQIFETQA